MKWYEWKTIRNQAEQMHGKQRVRQLGDSLLDRIQAPSHVRRMGAIEDTWVSLNRPYFSVWPVAMRALLKVKLDIPTSCVKLPLPAIVVKFGEGYEPASHDWKLQIMLVGEELEPAPLVAPGVPGLRIIALFKDSTGAVHVSSLVSLLYSDKTVEQALQLVRDSDDRILERIKQYSPEKQADYLAHSPPVGMDALCAQLVCGLCLLADDPSLITRDVLAADQHKVAAASPEQLERLVDKAVRRGKRGFSVGASWEQIPHYRRPHFGIRWYGPRDGQQTAKLVAISGAIVHRNKLSEVPTGYEDEELEA